MNVLQVFVFCTAGWLIINGYDFFTGADVDWPVRIMNFITSSVVLWFIQIEGIVPYRKTDKRKGE